MILDLDEIAVRLDDEEKLLLKYRVREIVADEVDWVVRTDRLLDVAEDRGILYVERDGEPMWVTIDEAMDVLPAPVQE